jgi:succinate dehydrogenase/fumarate reductase cytochrome b subunit
MTLVSLCLITLWMVLVVLGVTLAGFVHALVGAAVTLVVLTGKRGSRRARVAAAATAAAAATTLTMR